MTATCDPLIENSSINYITEFTINVFLHVSILFTFLIFLFFYIVEPLAKKAFQHEMDHLIENGINKNIPNNIDVTDKINLLKKFQELIDSISSDEFIQKYYNSNGNNNDIANNVKLFDYAINYITNNPTYIIDNIINEYKTDQPTNLIKIHNDSVYFYGYNIAVILAITTIILIIVTKTISNPCFNISHLLIENVLTFTFVGFAEYWFFTTYAFKFIPAPPSLLISSAINEIKRIL